MSDQLSWGGSISVYSITLNASQQNPKILNTHLITDVEVTDVNGSVTSYLFQEGMDQCGSGNVLDALISGLERLRFYAGSNAANLTIGTDGIEFTLGSAHSDIREYTGSGLSIYGIANSTNTGGDLSII